MPPCTSSGHWDSPILNTQVLLSLVWCGVYAVQERPADLEVTRDLLCADAPSPRYMRERVTWSGRVLRSEYLWAWRAGKRLA